MFLFLSQFFKFHIKFNFKKLKKCLKKLKKRIKISRNHEKIQKSLESFNNNKKYSRKPTASCSYHALPSLSLPASSACIARAHTIQPNEQDFNCKCRFAVMQLSLRLACGCMRETRVCARLFVSLTYMLAFFLTYSAAESDDGDYREVFSFHLCMFFARMK
jgi:hypothetical protein